MKEYLVVANNWMLWLSCLPVVAMVAIQAMIFVKKAKEAAPIVDLSESDVKKAFRVGATSAIGPALGVFVVMLGLMSAIGGPLAWQRLAIIGAAPTELAAAKMAAQAQGVTLGGQNYGLINFANACWVMALNGSAWLLSTALFSDKFDNMSKKIAGGSSKKLGLFGSAAMLGAMGFLTINDINKGLNLPKADYGYIACAITAAIAMVILEQIGKKFPKLVEFNLGIAMVIGMIGAAVFNSIAGV